MKNNLFRHPALILISLVFACLIWIAIMNTENPQTRKTYSSVPVTVTNTSYVESKKQLYAMVDGTAAVSVTITANRKQLERISSSTITAVADLIQIDDFNYPVYVPVNVSVPGISVDDIVVKPQMLEIKLEEIENVDFVLNKGTGGTKPGKRYEVGLLTVKPDTIKIRGPKSMIDIIDQVVAVVDVTGLRTDQQREAKLQIFDKNGHEFDEKMMSNLTIGDGNTKVTTYVDLYPVINDTTIEAETYGSPAEGYRVAAVTTTPSKLSVVGNDSAVEKFVGTGSVIRIPADSMEVDISGADSDLEYSIDIEKYLPEGISLAADISNTVVVSVKILPVNSISLDYDTKNIVKQYLSPDLSAVFDDSKLELRICSEEADLQNISEDDIRVSVDLKDCKPGNYTIPLDVILPEGCTLVNKVYADMTIAEVEKPENESASQPAP